MNRRPRRLPPRSGFTLVELLIVIVILAMLAALIGAAAVRAIGTANRAQIGVDLNSFDSAMQSYKADFGGAYPPDCSLLANNLQGAQLRQNRILVHIRRNFPRYNPGTYASLNSNNPGGIIYNFANAQTQDPTIPVSYGATTSNGVTVPGDLNNLDPAEALVFWLGGLPSPPIPDTTQNGKLLFKLYGFSADPTKPFQFGGSRIQGPIEFVTSRLGDADGDGWPEYYPPVGDVPQPPGSPVSIADPVPPFVYFDGATYSGVSPQNGSPNYPLSGLYPAASANNNLVQFQNPFLALWGSAIPYPTSYTGAGNNVQLTWVNPQKFQIISAGLDAKYWLDNIGGGLLPNTYRLYPAGTAVSGANGGYSKGDLDNQTNFTGGRLQDDQK